MNYIPASLFELENVNTLKVSGRGGKEKEISLLFPTASRISSTLYDYEIVDRGNILAT
jgi:hypothetical protein